MNLSIWALLAGIALLTIPGFSKHVPKRLRPSECTWLVTASVVVGATLVLASQILLSIPVVFGPQGTGTLDVEHSYLLAHLATNPSWVGWAAAALFAILIVSALLAFVHIQRTRQLMENLTFGEERILGERDVVVLPTDAVVAYASPSSGRRIILSTGLMNHLSHEQLEAVVLHEGAHVDNRHHAFLALAEVIDRSFGMVLPGARRTTGILRLSVERWADEAATSGNRRSQLQAAMTRVNDLDAISVVRTNLTERIEMLTRRPVHPSSTERIFAYSPIVMLSGIGLLCIGDGLGHVRVLAAVLVG